MIKSETPGEAQASVEPVLDRLARRWRLDEVTSVNGKPAELYYLVGIRKSVTKDQFLTTVQQNAGGKILAAELEIGDALAKEKQEAK